MNSQGLVTHDDIAAAYPAVREVVHHTPLTTCVSLTERCSLPIGSLFFKMENLQRTGSFKIRGAYHRLSQLSAVEDADIARAMLLLLERAKTVVEPAGAAGVAALLAGKIEPTGKTVATVSGGNVDAKFLADMIEREMIHANRYMHFFSAVPDRPGDLAALLELIAELKGNIITVLHNRISPSVPLGRTGVELLLEVRDEGHIAAIREALTDRNYRVEMLD